MPTQIADLLGKRWICQECGREHFVPTKWVRVGEGELDYLRVLRREVDVGKVALVVSDEITFTVAGRRVAEILRESEWQVKEVVLPLPLHATNKVAQQLVENWSPETVIALAVGSGTINDLVKWAASQMGTTYIAVPTAASMNGYTSPISALMIDGFKRTQPCRPPEGVLTEPSVVASAPQKMTASGYADLMSKTVADVDWQISNLLWGEPYCPLPLKLVTNFDSQLQENLTALARNEPNAVVKLLEALIASGMGMTVVGSSTPSSGAEHLISHWLEMKATREGKEPALHGLQVGIGTLVALNLYQILLETKPSDWNPCEEELKHPFEREGGFVERYGEVAERVKTEFAAKWLSREQANEAREKLAKHWSRVQEIVNSTWVPPELHRQRLATIGAATHPQEIGVSLDEIREAILHAREIRRRWTILDTAYLVGILPSQLDGVLKRCGWG